MQYLPRRTPAALALLLSPWLVGCPRVENPTSGKSAPARAADDHHHEAAPNGGTIFDWGGKYHVELTVDHGKQEATLYILGDDARTPAPIQPRDGQITLSVKDPLFQVALKASPLQADPPGSASRFVGKHEGLGNKQDFAGTVAGDLDGTPYASDFKEHDH